jgi:hypothetical protein
VALIAVCLAVLANLAFKAGLVVSIGGRTLARVTLPGLAALAAGLVAGLIVVA